MNDNENENILLAAIAIGFIENPDGTLTCTKEQLVQYSEAVAVTVIEQYNERENHTFP